MNERRGRFYASYMAKARERMTVTINNQLLAQLTAATARQASDLTLYDDRRDRPGADTARALAAELGELRRTAGGLARSIDQARELSVHLGND